MTQIKFRGIASGTDQWVYGLPHKVYKQNKIDSIQESDCNIEYIRVDTLGQYTNVDDKEGVEIYTGDIMGDEKDRYIVTFIGGAFKLIHPDLKPTKWSPNAHVWGTLQTLKEYYQSAREIDKPLGNMFKVLGNIHQHPHLLEPKTK